MSGVADRFNFINARCESGFEVSHCGESPLHASWQSCQASFQPPSIAAGLGDPCVSAPRKTGPGTLSMFVQTARLLRTDDVLQALLDRAESVF